MKLALLVLAALVVSVIAEHQCTTNNDCAAHNACHDGTQPMCEHFKCACSSHGKRDHVVCTNDSDCVGFDCTHLPGNTPWCSHHGAPEHGQNSCACQ